MTRDTFVLAGQSNAMGYSTNNQAWYSPSGLTVRNFGKDYLWHDPATDPIDVAAGAVDAVSANTVTAPRGHWALRMATGLMALTGRGVDLIPCAKDATAIAAWAPHSPPFDRATLYGAMAYRAQAIQRKIAAVLWWQGESDAIAQTTQAAYAAALRTLGDAIGDDLGCPLVACKFLSGSYPSPQDPAPVYAAIEEAWGTHNVVAGPDLSGIPTDDAYHALSDAKVGLVASLWTAAVLKVAP